MNEYWIVFKQANHWTQFFLKKGFGHCYILTKDKHEWFTVDAKGNQLYVNILPYLVTDNVPRMIKGSGVEVIRITTTGKDGIYFKLPSIVSCVSLVKYFIGIKIFALTPHQLYKKLMRKDNFKNITQSRVLI